MSFDFVAGDTGSVLEVQCVDDTCKPVKLTNYPNATLRWCLNPFIKGQNGAPDTPATYANRGMTIVDAELGKVQYKFGVGELVAGKMRFEVIITDSIGGVVTSTTIIEAQVRSHI